MRSDARFDAVNVARQDGRCGPVAADALAGLDQALDGEILPPTDEAFDEACALWNGMIQVTPGLVVRCRSTEDVVEAVQFAAERELVVSIRGGGHNVAGLALADDGMVIDLSAMAQVEVDPDARIAQVQGGALLGDVDAATWPHGLVTPTGFVSQTGLGGLLLRGGLGHLMRRWGLTCDNLVGAEIVTADGAVREVDEDSDPELLWALRGGPLDLGVVTRFDLRLHPLDHDVRLLMAVWPENRGVSVNRCLRDHMADAPPELGLISFYVTLPEDPALPEEVHGVPSIVVFGVWSGDPDDAEEVLAPILEHEGRIADLGDWLPFPEAQQALDDDYPDGARYYWKSLYLDGLSDEILEVLHRRGTARPSRDTTLDVWCLGGAIDGVDPESSAFPERGATHMIAIEANWEDPDDDDEHIAWARETFADLAPHATGGEYLNFPGSRDELPSAVDSSYGEAMERLRALQRQVDPAGLFDRFSRRG